MLNWRRDITALRGIAVLYVVWYHAGWLGATSGYLGVDAFFVVSGYLITSMLLGELETTGQVSLTRFWARRVKRLIPASATVIAAVLISSRWTLEPLRSVQTGRDAVSASTFWANVHFWLKDGDYFKSGLFESPLRHYWSLSLEEQYYLVLPILMMLAWKMWRERGVMVLLFSTITASFIYSLNTTENSSFYLLQSRAWQLGVGGALALAHHRSNTQREALGFASPGRALVLQRITWGVALLGLAAVMSAGFESKTTERVAVVACVAIMLHTGSGTAAAKFLRPLEWIGTISYSLYLWHWPLLIMSGRASRRIGEGEIGNIIDTRIPAVVLSVALAYLTYRYIENLRWSKLMSVERRTYIIGLSCLLVTISLAYVTQTQPMGSTTAAVTTSTTSSTTISTLTTTVFTETETEISEGMVTLLDGTLEIRDPELAADKGDVKPQSPAPGLPMSECSNDWPNQSECQTWGGPGPTVLMAGETEGWQWPFHYIGQKYGFRAVTIRGCVEPEGPVWGEWCDRWLRERWTPETPMLVSLSENHNLEPWIKKLGGATKKVAFISPVSSKESELCLQDALKYAECNMPPEDNTAGVDGIIYHDTNKWLCGTYCPGSINNHPVSRGRTVSSYTAIKLTDRIREVVESVAPEMTEVTAWEAPEAPTNLAEELERATQASVLSQAIAGRLDDVRNRYPEIDACEVGLPEGDRCLGVLDPTKPVVLVVGDSHAGQWAEVINKEVTAAGGQTLVTIGCKAMMQTEDTYNGTPGCRGFEDRLEKFVKTRKPVLIVASSKVGERGTLLYRVRGGVYGWVNRQRIFWERIAPGSGGVLIVADSPIPKDDIPLCLSDNASNTKKCGDTRAASETFYLKNAENKMVSYLKNQTGVPFRYIDPINWVCTKSWCPANTESSVVYRDNNHLAAEYVERIRSVVTEATMSMYRNR